MTKNQPLTLFPNEKTQPLEDKTKGGYDFGEVVSALQKSIRRGQEKEALFWAYELVDNGAWNYLFKRLRVIAAEDIGLADPQAAILTNSVYTGLVMEWAKRKAQGQNWFVPDMNIVGMVVMYLARAPKNRICDLATTLTYEKRKGGWKIEIPKEAVDQHTYAGKKLIKEKGIDPHRQFYTEGALIRNRKSVPKDNEYWKELMKFFGLDDIAASSENEELK